MKRTLILSLGLLCTACAGFGSPQPNGAYVAKDQRVDIAAFGSEMAPVYGGRDLKKLISQPGTNQIASLLAGYKDGCEKQVEVKTDPALIPIIMGLGQYVFNRSLERKEKQLEALKKGTVSVYSTSLVLDPGALGHYSCAIVSRHSNDGTLNLFVLIDITTSEGLTILEPTVAYAKNSVAFMAKGKHDITLTLGAAVLGVGKQENGLPILAATGQDAKKVTKLTLSSKDPTTIEDQIIIGPIPSQITNSPTILRLSLTETGDAGFDIDDRIAVNAALKESMGPALSEGLKAYLSE
ncbi:MAG: hypothetical protein H6987_13430 [Pseudomonadales bacterium]|nr:hypothetical protein [Pseudomonadales bacterium]